MHECVQHEERFVAFLNVLDVSHLSIGYIMLSLSLVTNNLHSEYTACW